MLLRLLVLRLEPTDLVCEKKRRSCEYLVLELLVLLLLDSVLVRHRQCLLGRPFFVVFVSLVIE